MQERDFKGVWIPKEIWLNEELSMIDKGILTEIASLDNENHCYATNEYFAKFCQVSVPTVTRSIQKLISLGYIEVVSFNGRNRIIKMINQPNQNDEAASSKRLASNIDTNKKENNNNTNTKVLVETEKPKKKNLYEKCIDVIDEFTDDTEIKELLVTYLRMRLEVKDKPLYINQFKGMINKLKELTDDTISVIQQSIDRGYLSFYPLSKNNNVKSAACENNVKSVRMTETEKKQQEDFITKMKKEGRKIEF
jgi:DNA-binding Lrp family transcriptional regulator